MAGCSLEGFSTNPTPQFMLWCWEAPQDLRQVPATTGIAFLAATIKIHKDSLSYIPRMQPLQIAPRAYVLPVIHIESDRDVPPEFEMQQKDRIAGMIAKLAGAEGKDCKRVQVDFDARSTERAFYCTLLKELRKQLPVNSSISVTALASWCLDDRWTDALSAQQIVPMFFSMGHGGKDALARALSRGTVDSGDSALAIGLSASEPDIINALGTHGLLRGRSIFLFASHGWTSSSAQKTEDEVRKWL
jgi:hypothetical protein